MWCQTYDITNKTLKNDGTACDVKHDITNKTLKNDGTACDIKHDITYKILKNDGTACDFRHMTLPIKHWKMIEQHVMSNIWHYQ